MALLLPPTPIRARRESCDQALATELLRPCLKISVNLLDLRIGQMTEAVLRNFIHELELAAAGRHAGTQQRFKCRQIVSPGNRQIRRLHISLAAAEVAAMAFGAVGCHQVPSARILWTKVEWQLARILRN